MHLPFLSSAINDDINYTIIRNLISSRMPKVWEKKLDCFSKSKKLIH